MNMKNNELIIFFFNNFFNDNDANLKYWYCFYVSFEEIRLILVI